jgi:hypothetical protein
MELFDKREGPFYIYLPFDQTLLAQRAGKTFLVSVDELLTPRAMNRSFPT